MIGPGWHHPGLFFCAGPFNPGRRSARLRQSPRPTLYCHPGRSAATIRGPGACPELVEGATGKRLSGRPFGSAQGRPRAPDRVRGGNRGDNSPASSRRAPDSPVRAGESCECPLGSRGFCYNRGPVRRPCPPGGRRPAPVPIRGPIRGSVRGPIEGPAPGAGFRSPDSGIQPPVSSFRSRTRSESVGRIP